MLIPIAEELKVELINYPYYHLLALKMVRVLFKIFLDLLGEQSYYLISEAKTPENYLFAQY